MRRFRHEAGYTIVEVMFFLIISVGLFGTAVVSISNQNQRTLFTNEVDRLQNRLQDAFNDVSTGYYPSNLQISCSGGASPAGPVITNPPSGTLEQGKSVGCIFVGKAFQFNTQNNLTNYSMYTIVGNRQLENNVNGRGVASISEAIPRLAGVLGRPGIVEQERLNAGLVVVRVFAHANPAVETSGFVILSDFGKTASIGGAVSGTASRVSLGMVRDTPLDMNRDSFVARTEEMAGSNIDTALANGGVVLCLQEAGGGRQASITIGGNNQHLNMERTIDEWPVRCNG